MSFLLRRRSNLYIADTSSKQKLFLGPDGVRYGEVSLYFTPGGEGHFYINLYGTCRFSGYQFSAQIPETGYDYLFMNNRLLFPRTINYCFAYCFWHFLWSNNSETGYRNANFFLNGLWRFLKNGHLPVNLHSSAPPRILHLF